MGVEVRGPFQHPPQCPSPYPGTYIEGLNAPVHSTDSGLLDAVQAGAMHHELCAATVEVGAVLGGVCGKLGVLEGSRRGFLTWQCSREGQQQ